MSSIELKPYHLKVSIIVVISLMSSSSEKERMSELV